MTEYQRDAAISFLRTARNGAIAMTGVAVFGLVGAAQDAVVQIVCWALHAVVWVSVAGGLNGRLKLMRNL